MHISYIQHEPHSPTFPHPIERAMLKALPKCDIPGVSWWIDKRLGRYRVQFLRGGQRKTFTMQTTHPASALREMNELAERFNARRFDPWKDRTLGKITVAGAIAKYFDSAAFKKLGAESKSTRWAVLEAFERTLPESLLLSALRHAAIAAYYGAPGRRRSTEHTYYQLIKIFLTWCKAEGLVDAHPMDGTRAPRLVKGPPKYFTPDQLGRLIQTIEADLATMSAVGAAVSDYLTDLPVIIRLFVETGLRRGELLHQRWIDVDLPARVIHVRAYHDERRGTRFSPKDTDGRVLPISPVAYEILMARSRARTDEDDTALVFPGNRGLPRDGENFTRTFGHYRKMASLPGGLTPHSLRHTFASWLASSGVPIITISKWLGHADLTTTMKYADLLPSASQWQGSRFHDELDSPTRSESPWKSM